MGVGKVGGGRTGVEAGMGALIWGCRFLCNDLESFFHISARMLTYEQGESKWKVRLTCWSTTCLG